MAWSGTGVFTGLHNWVTDQANSIAIRADRHKAQDDVFIAGINACVAKNGENSATGNLPMGGYKHTGVADGASADDYAALNQLQKNTGVYAATTGSSDAYVLTPSPAITAYAAGQRFIINASFTNAGAATINVSSLGAKALKKNGTVALTAGDIVSGNIYEIVYDGTNFQISNLILPDNMDLTGTLDVTGAATFDSTITGASTLDITGSCTLGGALDVTGNTTLGGTLDVTGNTDFVGQVTGGQVAYNAQTGTTYTLTATDEGKIVTLSNASAITLTLPQNSTESLPQGFNCIIRQIGAGQVTVATEGSDTLQSSGGATKLTGQYSEAQIDLPTSGSPNTWFMGGDIST